jgi:hypothetical protein
MKIKQSITPLVALVVIIILYGFAQLPEISSEERQQLAQRFNFSQLTLAEILGPEKQTRRPVNPHAERISGWISTVGAAVALNDLDGDGLANDICRIETRTNQVIVAPVPETGNRYQSFTLSAAPTLPYNDKTMAPMGCLPANLNEDNRMDILVYYWGRTPVAFLQTDKPMEYQPVEIVTEIERWFTNAATTADLDGDGHLDLIIANYFQDGARILDVNAETPDEMQHSMSRAYNAGGTYFFLGEPVDQEEKLTVHFQRVNGSEVLDQQTNYAWTLAVAAADLDGDLLPELYFANDFGPDRLLHNRSTSGQLNFARLEGKRGFTMPASKVVGKDSFKGMGVDFADLNSDGILDIFVSNIAAEYALEESHFLFVSTGETEPMKQGVAPYVDKSEPWGVSRSSWGWDSKLVDFDNDGMAEAIQATGFLKGEIGRWPELQQIAIGNDELLKDTRFWPPFKEGDDLCGQAMNPFYVRAKNGRYVNIATNLGLDQPYITRGIATADVDGDGDLDFALANQWEDSHFYRNDCPNQCGHFLGLHVRMVAALNQTEQFSVYPGHPTHPSHPAITATAKVTLPDGRKLVAQIDGGNGHSGKRSHDLHFGLGSVPTDKSLPIELSWRNGQGQIHQEKLSLAPGWHTVELNKNGTNNLAHHRPNFKANSIAKGE